MRVWFLGWEDPLEASMAIHSSVLTWRIPWTEECGRLLAIGWQRVGHDWSDLVRMHTCSHFSLCFPISLSILLFFLKPLSSIVYSRASLVAQMVKNPPAMREIRVWSLGQEDPLEKGMAIYSSILALRISWTEESGGLQLKGSQRVRHDWASITDIYSMYNIIHIF